MGDAPSEATKGGFTNLIIVCCHSIFTGGHNDPSLESSWTLKPFQSSDPESGRQGEHRTYVTHVIAGVQAIEDKAKDQLMISGGYTRLPELSEAESYAHVLRLTVQDRSLQYKTEEMATDSFQNLLFSIVLFRKMNGVYPRRVTVITHGFKAQRFLELHAPAIKWPENRIRVQGINPPLTGEELEASRTGEQENAYSLFEQDPYGVRPPLSDKRSDRRWTEDSVEQLLFPGIEAEVERLLRWNGGESGKEVFDERLPWED